MFPVSINFASVFNKPRTLGGASTILFLFIGFYDIGMREIQITKDFLYAIFSFISKPSDVDRLR